MKFSKRLASESKNENKKVKKGIVLFLFSLFFIISTAYSTTVMYAPEYTRENNIFQILFYSIFNLASFSLYFLITEVVPYTVGVFFIIYISLCAIKLYAGKGVEKIMFKSEFAAIMREVFILTIVFQVLYSMHRLMFLISINREYVFLGRMQIKYMENAASVT
ncbi:MAG: hypothetical protein LAT83_11090, partial [Kiritimatiellae bacterium]|nr:hypothetical protein [Kiritimatiellia bacterium]